MPERRAADSTIQIDDAAASSSIVVSMAPSGRDPATERADDYDNNDAYCQYGNDGEWTTVAEGEANCSRSRRHHALGQDRHL